MIAAFLERLYQGSFEGDEQAMSVVLVIVNTDFMSI